MSHNNTIHTTEMTVLRKGQPVTVEVKADVDSSIVAIQKVTLDGEAFLLDDNEWSAAKLTILHKVHPGMGYDKRANNLLRIAKQFPRY